MSAGSLTARVGQDKCRANLTGSQGPVEKAGRSPRVLRTFRMAFRLAISSFRHMQGCASDGRELAPAAALDLVNAAKRFWHLGDETCIGAEGHRASRYRHGRYHSLTIMALSTTGHVGCRTCEIWSASYATDSDVGTPTVVARDVVPGLVFARSSKLRGRAMTAVTLAAPTSSTFLAPGYILGQTV